MEHLATVDPAVHAALVAEARRQAEGLELIASENFVSMAVLESMANVAQNKYAEGLPGHRYYGGCEHVDVLETLARDRANQLFGSDHTNAQPHSGAQANMAAYFALVAPGAKLLGMDLSHGGHLTHGSPVNFSGRFFEVSAYGVRPEDGTLDYDLVRERALAERPDLIVAGASAYPRTIDFSAFGEIAREVGAYLLVDMAHIAGLVATGHHPSPVPHADVVTTTTHKTLRGPRGGLILCRQEHASKIDKSVFPFTQGGPLMHIVAAKAVALLEAHSPEFADYSGRIVSNARVLAEVLMERGLHLVSGGTDNHLVLVDLRPSHPEVTGKQAEAALEAAGITVNKNTVPGETRSPFVTSGLRIGTPAITSRGMGEDELRRIGGWIAQVIDAPTDDLLHASIRADVRALCDAFPLYEELLEVV